MFFQCSTRNIRWVWWMLWHDDDVCTLFGIHMYVFFFHICSIRRRSCLLAAIELSPYCQHCQSLADILTLLCSQLACVAWLCSYSHGHTTLLLHHLKFSAQVYACAMQYVWYIHNTELCIIVVYIMINLWCYSFIDIFVNPLHVHVCAGYSGSSSFLSSYC